MKQKKWKISRVWRRVKIRRKYKDQFFQRVFSDKKDLLDLYNAVNGTAYTDPDALEITTLEDVIYLSMKNDISFIISSTLNLYEHQSTFNPNMPIRGLMYFARLYEAYIHEQEVNIYGRYLIKLPTPQFIVFYNGKEDIPDELELRLSEAFEPKVESDKAVLECRARVININYGHNEQLLSACKRLHDYAYFIKEINQNIEKYGTLETAIKKAIETCIQQGVLEDILMKCKSEVFGTLLTEYDERKHMRLERKAEREQGRKEMRERVNALNLKLAEENRVDDIIKAAKDKAYQEKLFKEFRL